jgi:enhancing lycopene biosynthesis protein 2
LAKVLGNVEVTIGQDKETTDDVKKMGATHKETTHGEVIIDKKNKIVTTPCYMLNATIGQIGDGANNLVKAIFEMI